VQTAAATGDVADRGAADACACGDLPLRELTFAKQAIDFFHESGGVHGTSDGELRI